MLENALPTPAVLSSLARHSFQRGLGRASFNGATPDFLAIGALQSSGEGRPNDHGFLVSIADDDESWLFLGGATRLPDSPVDGEGALNSSRELDERMSEEGWTLESSSATTGTSRSGDSTPAVIWAVDSVGWYKGFLKLLVGAVDMTGLAQTLTVEINKEKYQTSFSDRAAVLYTKVDLPPNAHFAVSKAVLGGSGTVMDGEQFDLMEP